MAWHSFIEQAQPGEHAVLVYDDLDDLAASVRRFLAPGLAAGAPAVLIATAGHRERFTRELAVGRSDLELLQQRGQLTVRDAEETLASFMVDELPSADRFAAVVGGLVDEAAMRFPGQTLRAFGEMVDILWARGQSEAAIAVEELWNELAERRSFALLCGYRLDIFDIDVQTGALPEVFRMHSHRRLTCEPSRLAAAVDKALTELVGRREAAYIYLDVAEQVGRDTLPRAQALLTWLSATNAPLAKRLLERARTHYSATTRGATNAGAA